ncbi:MAG: hypothetical protein KJ958_02440 [Gammaproteobacteria bacterium]|nr:hypothetical protein [Gammaproteobacteria bacterium]MBU1978008.1 hypothetical protein [Gammaproteobacteria bacterium]
MMRKRFGVALFWVFAAICLSGTSAAWAQNMRKLVLVAASDSDITRLPPADTRRLFLGVAVAASFAAGESLHPLRNTSDPVLEESFLQKVIFMSRDAYERALLTRVMHGGGTRPALYDSEALLVNTLLADKFAVTYMWADKAVANSNLKIVAEPW